ncbi:MAG TPA: hypothetical protein VMW57_05555 [Methyloceanibacter sp.]|nr:hypothetical protein [Methyloceanibacter sp.]
MSVFYLQRTLRSDRPEAGDSQAGMRTVTLSSTCIASAEALFAVCRHRSFTWFYYFDVFVRRPR